MNRLTIIFRTSTGCDRSNIAGSREGEVQSEEEEKSWSGAAIGSSGEFCKEESQEASRRQSWTKCVL